MYGLIALDRLAAGRGGDGLDPRLRVLLEERQRIEAGQPGVVELDPYRDAPMQVAGPHPAAGAFALDGDGETVLSFPAKRSTPSARVRTKTSSMK